MAGKKKASKPKSSSSFSSSTRKLTCPTCGYVTFLKARFTKHVKYHSMPFIKCEFCDFRTQYTWNLDRHMKNHNSLGKMECPLCNFTCDMKQSLTSHVQNHHNNVPEEVLAQFRTSCASSPRKSPNPGSRRQSSECLEMDFYEEDKDEEQSFGVENPPAPKRVKKTGEDDDRRLFMKKFYKCRFCNFNALSELGLNRHVAQSHPSEGGANKCPNLLQKMKTKVQMPTLIKKCSTSTSAGPPNNGLKTKPMPSLIPIPKSNNFGVVTINPVIYAKLHSSPSDNTNQEQESSIQSDYEEAYAEDRKYDAKKIQFLQNLGLTPKPFAENKKSSSSASKKVQPQRRTSFFEKLSKKLTSNNTTNLSQTSTSIMKTNNSNNNSNSIISITSNSTRCQYCRHRCKTSGDLIHHLEQCEEAQRFLVEEEENDEQEIGDQQIFVWNDNGVSGVNQQMDEENHENFHNFEGFSALSLDIENDGNYTEQMSSPTPTCSSSPRSVNVTKSRKVYQCPQKDCEFWATTASRFHVHIVGHYNTKPFECSQCSYRSNWRWDITKHIKLKTMRDPSHTKAKVLLTHKSGERNYRKYDRYLVPMAVTYSADAKLPDCSTVASKRPDVELAPSPSPPKSCPSPKSSSTSSKAVTNVGLLSMPKLTKAPIPTAEGSYANLRHALNSDSLKVTSALPILKPIITISPSKGPTGRTFVEKKMLAGGEMLQNMESLGRDITVTPIWTDVYKNRLQVPGQNKTTTPVTWMCKKCHFQHSNKDHVIVHINQIHKPKTGESMSILSQNNLVQVGRQLAGSNKVPSNQTNNEDFEKLPCSRKDKALHHCQKCSFSTTSEAEISEHYENCSGEVYACAYCAEEFPSISDAQQHILLHGINPPSTLEEDFGGDEAGETSGLILPEEICIKPRGAAQQAGLIYKKYHCQECPYVTDSKGQFIYHKKFHIPSPNSPYKCNSCSYRVSHKHLLQQHVRVHLQEESLENHSEHEQELDNQDMSLQLRPRVLVWKDGQPYSVGQRCRFCPQVFVSRQDLLEHEEQHDSDGDEEIDDKYGDGALNLSMKSEPRMSRMQTQGEQVIGMQHPKPNSRKQIQTQEVLLYLCEECPARFLYEKELRIHHTFHERKNEFTCTLCSYSARQEVPHLMSHMKVHSPAYQVKTQSLLQGKYNAAPSLKFECCGVRENKKQSMPSVPPLRKMQPVSISATMKQMNESSSTSTSSSICDASIPCRRCPARFNALSTFLQHSQHHGKNTQYKCKHCDFGAESRNNLTLHSILHAGSEVTIEPEIFCTNTELEMMMDVDRNNKDFVPSNQAVEKGSFQQTTTAFPCTGEELEGQMDFSAVRAFQGNPEFQYPTYVKNGRIKSKRYKCFKCPSAFEKRDQYKVHVGLHGSDQRYKCTVCDYSVTYYANFIQHLRKHENQPNVTKEQLVATPLSKMSKIVTPMIPPQGQVTDQTERNNTSKAKKVVPPLVLKVPKTSMSLLRCSNCPFTTDKTSTFLEHEECHGSCQQEKCPFCDFASKDKESLKGHLRVHFDTDFTPVMMSFENSEGYNDKSDEAVSPDSSDSEVDDYEAVVKKANKKKVLVHFKPEISIDHC